MNNLRKQQQPRLAITIGIAFFFAYFVGCSSAPPVQEYPDTANVVEELNSFKGDVSSALESQVNVLSPHNFSEAQSYLEDAKKSLDDQKDSRQTLHKIAQGRAYLKAAHEVTLTSQTNLGEVIVARKKALSMGASGYFESDFRNADEQLREVTSEIEKNDLRSATLNAAALQSTYLDLELRAIQKINLAGARGTIDQAIKDGAKEYAPQSLAIAERNYKDTEAYITANRHESQEIHNRSRVTTQSADHLAKIAHESKSTKKVNSEELALQSERKQNQINEGKANLNEQLGVSNALRADNRSLESERTMNDRFERARNQFTKEEAEVYKQGDSLTIRLRGLEFPSSQSVLKGSNFPLLAKVQQVIKDFGSSTVVIEGHTDSIGGKAQNAKLSEERALAVKQYFVANDALPEQKIDAIGYGYQKPLATNKTSLGRAQNRRVDVIIKAD